MPGQLLGRPAGTHLLYVVALIILVIGLTLLHARTRAVTVVLLVIAVGLTLSTVRLQMRGLDGRISAGQSATIHPARSQVCEDHDAITACAFPDFRNWISDWDEVASAVIRRTPTEQKLYIRQRDFIAGRVRNGITPQAPLNEWAADDRQAGTPGAIAVGTDWGTGSPELELAAGIARQLVTGQAQQSDIMPVCGAQAVSVLWLAGQANTRAYHALQRQFSNGSGTVVIAPADFGTGFAVTHRDAAVALQVLHHPSAAVATTVRNQWSVLTDSKTTTEQAAQILGVHGPDGPEAEGGRC